MGDFSRLELLTLESFISHGHEFHLWMYDSPTCSLPNNVIVRDANEILTRDKIFTYKGLGDCRKDSLGGFSDLFRYSLLYKIGGWYVDMDVTCLSNFNDLTSPYILRKHKTCGAVANIIKCPKESDFLASLIEESTLKITENNSNWILPLEIFNQHIVKYNLDKFFVPNDLFGDDDYETLKQFKYGIYFLIKDNLPKKAIHWCREASYGKWDYKMKYDWEKPIPLSLYYNLLDKHCLLHKNKTIKSINF